MDEQTAGVGPVDGSVRPVAWITVGGWSCLRRGEGPVRAMPEENADCDVLVPLYTKEAMDVAIGAAVEAEREQWLSVMACLRGIGQWLDEQKAKA